MIARSAWTGWVLAVSVAAAPLGAESLPDRGAYAWRFALEGEEGTELRAARLPFAVYRSVTDPALRDLGVYNAAGEAVPRIIAAPVAATRPPERTVALTPVPLFGAPAEQREQLRLLMQQGAGGTTLSLDTHGSDSAAGSPAALAAYIVDLRAPHERIEALRFDWGGSASGFIGSARIETGDDLQRWRSLGTGTLADLAYEETRIEQNRVALTGAADDFLRITWSGLPAGWALASLTGILRADVPVEDRDVVALDPVAVADDGRTLTFDAGGFPPVDRLRLVLPGDNVVLRARLLYRSRADDAWHPVHDGVFYHVSRDGSAVESPAVPIAPVRAAEWQVRIASGTANGGLRLELGWRPERLLFLAQGAGPFELVSGRARDRIEEYPQDRLLGDRALFTTLEATRAPGEARVGPREELAGAAALTLGSAARWRTALVWAGLIGAVLVVGGLAFSLLRELKRAPS